MWSFYFAAPWLLLMVLAGWLLPRSKGWRWRWLSAALLLLALAQPQLDVPGQRGLVLVEVSDAVEHNALERLAALELEDFAPYEVLFFAGQTVSQAELYPDGQRHVDLQANRQRQALQPQHVDIAQALQRATASGAGRVLLLSSGIASRGDVLAALPDVPVDVVAIEPVANVRLEALLAPDSVSVGEPLQVTAVIHSDVATELMLQVQAGTLELPPIEQRLEAGQTSLSFSFIADAEHVSGDAIDLEAQLMVPFVQPRADDIRQTRIALRESPQILVMGDPMAALMLEQQGFDVQRGSVTDLRLPLPYAALVLRAGASALSSGQEALLVDYVHNGGGLLMTGGEQSFGLGGWYRSPVEAVLPVETALPTDMDMAQVAIVMVIDRSGSMRAERPSRMSLARQGATNLVDIAHQDDILGLIAFDHEYDWIFELRQATSRGKQEMRQAISRLQPGGGTVISPAYRQAIAALREHEASVRHIIILTDGEFFDGTGMQGSTSQGSRPDFEAMAAEAYAEGITTTTIGIGEADFATIERMAVAGGGRFYGVNETGQLPQIFTGEALSTSRSAWRNNPTLPQLRNHPLTQAFATPPLLEGYIASLLKDDSEMLLAANNGEPILAISRHRRGRSAALTADLNRASGAFSNWSDLPSLLSTVVRWLSRNPDPYGLQVNHQGERTHIVVDAVQAGEFLDGQRLELRHGSQRIRLEQTAPGRYEAWLEESVDGALLSIYHGNEAIAQQRLHNPGSGLERQGAEQRLEAIAAQSGGHVLTRALAENPRYQPPPQRRSLALWPYIALLGLLSFVAELCYRRWRTA